MFEICYTVQNVVKGNKIAKTGLKTCFYSLKLALVSVLNGTIERVQNALKTLNKPVKNAYKPSHDCVCLRLKRTFN